MVQYCHGCCLEPGNTKWQYCMIILGSSWGRRCLYEGSHFLASRSGSCFPEGTLQMNCSDSRSPCTHTLSKKIKKRPRYDECFLRAWCPRWLVAGRSFFQAAFSQKGFSVFGQNSCKASPMSVLRGWCYWKVTKLCGSRLIFIHSHMTTDPSILNYIMSSLPWISSSHWQGYTAVL